MSIRGGTHVAHSGHPDEALTPLASYGDAEGVACPGGRGAQAHEGSFGQPVRHDCCASRRDGTRPDGVRRYSGARRVAPTRVSLAMITSMVVGGVASTSLHPQKASATGSGQLPAGIAVSVGYAGSPGASGFYPNPWYGAPGVTFEGWRRCPRTASSSRRAGTIRASQLDCVRPFADGGLPHAFPCARVCAGLFHGQPARKAGPPGHGPSHLGTTGGQPSRTPRELAHVPFFFSTVSAASVGRHHEAWGHLMLYLPVIIIAALATTAAMTRRSPRTAIAVGVVALAAAIVAVTVAELTGNLLLFYLGNLAAPFGVTVLLVGITSALRSRATIACRHQGPARKGRPASR